MAREPRRIPHTGSTFIRRLAALDDAPTPPADDAFAERLSRWFDWTHAISLSAVLGGLPARATGAAGPDRRLQAHIESDWREYARVRAALAELAAEAPTGTSDDAADAEADLPAYRQRYAACQHAMATHIEPLRRRVRATLAAGPPALAKLAELDGLMEQALAARERTLLSTVAGRLGPRLRDCGAAQLDTFRQEMAALLLAELDLRLQPVEGLLDASRPWSSHPHA